MTAKQIDWDEDPSKLDGALTAAKSETNKDLPHYKFYAYLRYARPTSAGLGGSAGGNGGTGEAPSAHLLDSFAQITDQLGHNITAEVNDACTAKICQRLRAKTIPVAAKPDIARACTLYSRIQDGVIEQTNFFEEATRAWEDIYSFPNGYVFFEIDDGSRSILSRRFDPRHVYYLTEEGINPVHLYAEEAMSRSVVLAMFPDMKMEIEAAAEWSPEKFPGVTKPSLGHADTIKVIRAWKRRVGSVDGRYIMSLEGGKVLNGKPEKGVRTGQPWKYDFFPFAVFRGRYDFAGFGGIPLGRTSAPYHLRINRLTRIADDSFVGAVPIVWSPISSKLDELSNIPFQIGKYAGNQPPTVQQLNPVSEQVLAERREAKQACYEAFGINRSIAQGQAPKGVTAAVAIRETIGLADARAAEYQKHWERGWRDAGHIIVAFANELKKLKVRPTDPNSDIMEELDVSTFRLDRDDYRVTFGLTSALSQSIHGLISDLAELKDLGTIDAITVAKAIGNKIPDVQAEVDRITAAHRLAEKMVQDALEKGIIPVPPSGKMMGKEGNAALILLCRQAWCGAMVNPGRYSPRNLEILRKLHRSAEAKDGAPLPQIQTVTPGGAIAPNAITTIGAPVVQPVQPVAPVGA